MTDFELMGYGSFEIRLPEDSESEVSEIRGLGNAGISGFRASGVPLTRFVVSNREMMGYGSFEIRLPEDSESGVLQILGLIFGVLDRLACL